ncbi:gamma-glutamylcyclotransferase family protein [Haloarchaeobius sp. HRN-SO-5]|uniref:gamma-glutamylcyclotransferase family protein n=1 Tax=Haloarchaeobius sp. HRN-SO-5 TaxID=3446118 RepID=UPI003EB8B8D3
MDVFVYGTLTDPDRVDDLLDDWTFGPDAVLRGVHRVDGRYPTLAPGGEVRGRLLRTTDLDALDAYEGVDRGLYARVAVARAAADDPVAVYVGDPVRLGTAESVELAGDGPLFDRLVEFVETRATVRTSRE